MNVLILSLAYAPFSGVGAARMTSLSKYLLNRGCRVTVVCYDSMIFGEKQQAREIPSGVERVVVQKLSGRRNNLKNLENIIMLVTEKQQFDVCISSVGPFETMFFIHKIWTKRHVPYIIDYRDPWLYEKSDINRHGLLKYKLLLRDKLCAYVERKVVKHAEKIVLVTERCKEDLIKRYPFIEAKCCVIFNGYEDIPRVEYSEKGIPYVIGIAGKFSYYNPNAANDFLVACEKVSSIYPIKLLHIGTCEEQLQREHPEVYVGIGEKDYAETISELSKMDALLITYAHTSGLGTKVFDYIALNKPIIYAGVAPSELADFVGQFENSYICRNIMDIETALLDLTEKDVYGLTAKEVECYSRKHQNERYYIMLNKICDSVD